MVTFTKRKKEKAKEGKMINEKFTTLDIFVLFAVNFPVRKHIMFHHCPRKLFTYLGLERFIQLDQKLGKGKLTAAVDALRRNYIELQ